MDSYFSPADMAGKHLPNRFVLAPIKTALGAPDGTVTRKQLDFYSRIAKDGPAILVIEPAAVAQSGREHPKQLRIDTEDSVRQLGRITRVIHNFNRLAAINLNHAGAAANPKANGGTLYAPSAVTCPASGNNAQELSLDQISEILNAYRQAAAKAQLAGFDFIEIQGGHGYLISQFCAQNINIRNDNYGKDKFLFAEKVFDAVAQGAPGTPLILRISADEMSQQNGMRTQDIINLVKLAEKNNFAAVHASMGSACYSPPWYYHHGSLPDQMQLDALKKIRKATELPLIAAGRMGREEKIEQIAGGDLADMIALGRPLVADPDFVSKLSTGSKDKIMYCGYCLQGCLGKVKTGLPIGCNFNPLITELATGTQQEKTRSPEKILVAGGGAAGLTAGIYLGRQGHNVTLAEKDKTPGGQLVMAAAAPGKESIKAPVDALIKQAYENIDRILTETPVNESLLRQEEPDVLIWATGAKQNIPEIKGLETQNTVTSLEYFNTPSLVKGKRILVIGAGRIGLEITEILAKQGYEVTATKRSDTVGSGMEMVTKKLLLGRLGKMDNVTISPLTTITEFSQDSVIAEKEGKTVSFEPFDTVILASGLLPQDPPPESFKELVPKIIKIGDAKQVSDIFDAVHDGYQAAVKNEELK